MKVKIVLFGFSPLPGPDALHTGFPEFRTAQFLLALLEDGHDVVLIGRERAREGKWEALEREFCGRGFIHVPLSLSDFQSCGLVKKIKNGFRPDLLVSSGPYFSGMTAGQAKDGEPLFIDIPGDPMVEAQLLSSRISAVHPLYLYREALTISLMKGDFFSTISPAQRYALIGELGMVGRLPPPLTGYDMVSVIPPSIPLLKEVAEGGEVMGEELPSGAIPVISTGSFNTWLDVETLFRGVEMAMEEMPELVLMVTGRGVKDLYIEGYRRFTQLVEGSAFRERFRLLGHLPLSQLIGIIRAAHLGIISDLPSYEAELGERTRLLLWGEQGVPAVVTPISSLCREFCEKGLAIPYTPRDPLSLCRGILEGISEMWQGKRGEIENSCRERFSPLLTTAPLRRWAEGGGRLLPSSPLDIDLFSMQQNELIRLRRLLHATWDSPTWRFLSRIHRLFKGG